MNAEEIKRLRDKEDQKKMTTAAGAPVANSQDSMTAGPRPDDVRMYGFWRNLHI